jgi:hypothetical protein
MLTPSQAVSAYASSLEPLLTLEPAMLIPPHEPQAKISDVPEPGTMGLYLLGLGLLARWKGRAAFVALMVFAPLAKSSVLTVDFANGPPSPGDLSISKVTPSTGLDFSGGKMNLVFNSPGDGVLLDLPAFSAVCVQFDDLSLQGFSIGDGLSFEVLHGGGLPDDMTAVQLFEIASSVQFKVTETKNHVVTTLTASVENINASDVGKVQIDWIPFAGRIDRILIEITTKDGRKITKGQNGELRSNFEHMPGAKSAYRLTGVNIATDPTLSMGRISFDSEHVPEPATLALIGIGLLSLLAHRKRSMRQNVNIC